MNAHIVRLFPHSGRSMILFFFSCATVVTKIRRELYYRGRLIHGKMYDFLWLGRVTGQRFKPGSISALWSWCAFLKVYNESQTSCAGGHNNMPRPLQVDLWPFDLESGVRVTCYVGYLCANVSLPRPLSAVDLGPMYSRRARPAVVETARGNLRTGRRRKGRGCVTATSCFQYIGVVSTRITHNSDVTILVNQSHT